MKSLVSVVVLAAVGVAGLAGCSWGSGDVVKHEVHSYKVDSPINALTVRGDAGPIEIVGSDSAGITVQEKWSFATNRQKPRTTHDVLGSALTLRYSCPTRVIGFNACGVSYRVQVPRNMAVNVSADNSSIRASGLRGGAVSLRSDSGSITAEDMQTSSFSGRSESGAIRLSGRADAVLLSTDSGAIDATGLRAARLNARSDSGSMELRFTEPPAGVVVRSDAGSVMLALPAGTGYAITERSDSGGRDIDQSLLNGNSPNKIQVTTDSGSISINPA